MPTPQEIKCGVYPVWRRMSAHGSVPVDDLTGTERGWAALLVRHRLAAVRARRLVQLDRAAVMSNWTALESGQLTLAAQPIPQVLRQHPAEGNRDRDDKEEEPAEEGSHLYGDMLHRPHADRGRNHSGSSADHSGGCPSSRKGRYAASMASRAAS